MHIDIECATCDTVVQATVDLFGQQEPCPVCGETIKIPDGGAQKGMHLDGFSLRWSLGHGSIGEVFRARQTSLRRGAAVKVLKPQLARIDALKKAFLTSAGMVAQLEHPSLTTVLQAGEDTGLAYVATNFVDGDTLSERIKNRPMAEPQALKCMKIVLEALDYGWSRVEMPHLALKPNNIMIDYHEQVKVVDFGLNSAVIDTAAQRNANQVIGTPEYLSPEQIRGETNLDFRSDQYAVGVLLYYLLTGTHPYRGENRDSIMAAHLQEPLEPMDMRAPECVISEACKELVTQLLSKDREARFAGHKQAIDAIDKILAPPVQTPRAATAGAAAGPGRGTQRSKTAAGTHTAARTSAPAANDKSTDKKRETKKKKNKDKSWRNYKRKDPNEMSLLEQLGAKRVALMIFAVLFLGAMGFFTYSQIVGKGNHETMTAEELAAFQAKRPKVPIRD